MSSEYSLEKELLEKIEQLHEKVEKQEQKIERQERKIEELEEGKNVDRSHDPVSEGLSRRGFLKKLGAGVLGIGALSLPVASKVTISDSGISKDGSSFWFSGLSSSYDLSGQNITDGGTVIWDTTNSEIPASRIEQGAGSGLDADTLDGKEASEMGTAGISRAAVKGSNTTTKSWSIANSGCMWLEAPSTQTGYQNTVTCHTAGSGTNQAGPVSTDISPKWRKNGSTVIGPSETGSISVTQNDTITAVSLYARTVDTAAGTCTAQVTLSATVNWTA